jgi:hypothetical protein
MSIGWSVPKAWVNKKDYNDIIREVCADKNIAKYMADKRIEARKECNRIKMSHDFSDIRVYPNLVAKNINLFNSNRKKFDKSKNFSMDNIQQSRFNKVKRLIISNYK